MSKAPLIISLVGLLCACSPAKLSDLNDDGVDTDNPGDTNTGDSGDTTPPDDTTDPNDIDDDGDGYTENEGDCDDTDADTSPDGEEDPNDGENNDCDEYTDEIEVCDGVYSDIQEALDDASDGGTVLICAGTYPENLEISNKELLIVGVEGADVTTVTGGANGSPVLRLSQNAEVVIMGLTFTGGEVTENGGGILCSGSDLDLVDSSVTGNSAGVNGGGIAANNCDVEISGSTISSNTTLQYGGGLYLTDTKGSIEESIIADNTALEGGGLFLYDGNTDLLNNTISGNLATTEDEEAWGPGGGGGGLWVYTNATISGNTISGNTSQYHGAGAYFYYGSPDVIDNVVEGNVTWEDGAGVYFNQPAAPLIQGNTIQGNEAYDDAGGLRIYRGYDAVVLENSSLTNVAGDDGGGAKMSHSEHTFQDNYVAGNITDDAGGGLELDNDSSHTEGNTFEGNTAGRGGGVHNWRTEAPFEFVNNQFIDNVAEDCGGGIQFDNNPYWVSMINTTFEGNEAVDGAAICTDIFYRDPEDVGGAKDYYQDSYLRVYNSVFVDNNASDDAVVYIKAGTATITNVVMDGNYGADTAAIVSKGSTVTLMNSILTDNSGGAIIAGELDDDKTEPTISISYSNLYDNDSGVDGLDEPVGSNGNIDEDPDFTGNYELAGSSPCIDAGSPSISDNDGSRSDMGIYGGPNAQ